MVMLLTLIIAVIMIVIINNEVINDNYSLNEGKFC